MITDQQLLSMVGEIPNIHGETGWYHHHGQVIPTLAVDLRSGRRAGIDGTFVVFEFDPGTTEFGLPTDHATIEQVHAIPGYRGICVYQSAVVHVLQGKCDCSIEDAMLKFAKIFLAGLMNKSYCR